MDDVEKTVQYMRLQVQVMTCGEKYPYDQFPICLSETQHVHQSKPQVYKSDIAPCGQI